MATEQLMPRLSDSMEEGILLEWRVAEGDPVSAGQELAEIETDKATMPLEAEADGTVLALLFEAGAVVPVGAPLVIIGEAGELAPAGVAAAPNLPRSPPPHRRPRSPHPHGTPIGSRPRHWRAASPAALGIDLAAIAGSGPRGRIVRSDVEAAAAAPAPAPEAVPVPAPRRMRATASSSSSRGCSARSRGA